jgi:hypothetical protein
MSSSGVKTTYENVGVEGDVPGNGNGKLVLTALGIVYYPAAADSANKKVKIAWGDFAQPSHKIKKKSTQLKLMRKSGKAHVFVLNDGAQLVDIDADISNCIQARAAKPPPVTSTMAHDSITSFTTQTGHESMRSSTMSPRADETVPTSAGPTISELFDLVTSLQKSLESFQTNMNSNLTNMNSNMTVVNNRLKSMDEQMSMLVSAVDAIRDDKTGEFNRAVVSKVPTLLLLRLPPSCECRCPLCSGCQPKKSGSST